MEKCLKLALIQLTSSHSPLLNGFSFDESMNDAATAAAKHNSYDQHNFYCVCITLVFRCFVLSLMRVHSAAIPILFYFISIYISLSHTHTCTRTRIHTHTHAHIQHTLIYSFIYYFAFRAHLLCTLCDD